jgi:hypothetical protein
MTALASVLACLLTGCVERRFVITTTAPGMPPERDLGSIIIDEHGMPLGSSPADKPFVYYGKYRFTAIKDGYQTTAHEENVRPPWFEWVPLDFVSENLIPWTIRDVRHVRITLQPMPMVPPEMVLQQGQALRQRGQAIGVPLGDPLIGAPVMPQGTP